MKTRDFSFCNYVCDELHECENSWGDCSVSFKCKRENYGRISMNEWSKMEVPRKCKYKMIYKVADKEALDKYSEVAFQKKQIRECEKKRELILQEAGKLTNEIMERQMMILEIEHPYVCSNADIPCTFSHYLTTPATCMKNFKCKYQRKRKNNG